MHKLREILRLKLLLGRSHRDVQRSLGVSVGVVSGVWSRAKALKLDWAAVDAMDDDGLATRLYGPRTAKGRTRPLPDAAWIDIERRRPGVTLELLHVEYLEQYPDGYRYTAFCDYYRAWLKKRRRSMRQTHKAGDKAFVDYSGKKPCVVDNQTGEVQPVELFVGVLGASNYTFVEATETQRSPDWIASHVRMLEYFGGVPRALVPDQLKSGVTKACRYEPKAQRTYADLARHYDTAVVPARPGKPKDKAKVEVGVQVAQRWILARLRKETFFSLAALNERIAELLEDLNHRPMKSYGNVTRRELFDKLDRPALHPLPADRFVYAEWKTVTVNIDYHVEVDRHYYSVPHGLAREEVEARFSATTVEILHRGDRVAAHARSYKPGRHTTVPDHMPKSHRAHLEWTPSRLIHWAATIGPRTAELVRAILESRPHPEQGYRSCLGILRLAKRYGEERLEAACSRGCAANARSYRHIDSILRNGLDRVPLDDGAEPTTTTAHENVRGPGYYH